MRTRCVRHFISAGILLGVGFAAGSLRSVGAQGCGDGGACNPARLNGVIEADQQAGVDACAKINAGLRALPASSGTVDARGFQGVQACASDMFAGFTTTDANLLLGNATFRISAEQHQPSQVHVVGVSPGNRGSVIQASSAFPVNTPLWQMTNGGRFNHNSVLRDVRIDCNGVAGTTGIYSTDINEKSGPRNVTVVNCPLYGVNIDASRNEGPGPAQTYVISDLEVYPGAAGGASTIGLRMVGNGGGCPAAVENVTVVGKVGYKIQTGIYVGNCVAGRFATLHTEEAVLGVEINETAGAVYMDVSGNAGETDVFHVDLGGSNSFTILGLVRGGAKNILNDVPRGIVNSDSFLSWYLAGSGAIGSETILSESARISKVIAGNLTVKGNLRKSASDFEGDRSLDTAGENLARSVVGSPERMKICSGVVTLNASGEAEVRLPDYFEILNRDFRYQLTPVGAYAPVFIAAKVKDNAFRIAGGTAGLEVSWQVTGVRRGDFAEGHRIRVEKEKADSER
jgi:hypothetical protein